MDGRMRGRLQVGNTENAEKNLLGAIILAGGQSSRMGTDKALLDIGGQPLLRHLCAQLLGLGLRSIAVATGNKPENTYRDALEGLAVSEPIRCLRDMYPGSGPLAGLHAGLGAAEGEGFVFVMACDMPQISETLFARIAAAAASPDCQADVVLAAGQPFHACYQTRVVLPLENKLKSGDLRVMSFLRGLNSLAIEPTAEEQAAFVNLNTPEDYAAFASASTNDSLSGPGS